MSIASTTVDQSRPRILSGVQPSGKLHIGNYFGAIKQHIERQDKGDCFYFIADYHALTTLKEAEEKEIAAAATRRNCTFRHSGHADPVHKLISRWTNATYNRAATTTRRDQRFHLLQCGRAQIVRSIAAEYERAEHRAARQRQ